MAPERETDSDSDSEEEAPEELTFQHTRRQESESARVRKEAASREKVLLKEKRKRKQALFSEQKKKRLLSDDFLQTVSALPDKLAGPSKASEKTKNTGDEEEEHEDKNTRGKKLLPRKSLEENYNVVHLYDAELDPQQQKAKKFLHKMLYGKSKNRTTVNEFLSTSRKTSERKLPAFQFTDDTWGEEEKKKAKKFNLKYTNRKKRRK